jgi:hypothetical protein
MLKNAIEKKLMEKKIRKKNYLWQFRLTFSYLAMRPGSPHQRNS